jgi:hypothetical protein
VSNHDDYSSNGEMAVLRDDLEMEIAESVAGKNRAAAKPCPVAGNGSASVTTHNINTAALLKNFISSTNRKSFVVIATV